MDRTAIFVDVGYLYAQGSTALSGSQQPRSMLSLDKQKVLEELKSFALRRTERQILRIYWYDGAHFTGPTAEHAAFAYSEDVKIRLGLVNSRGQQKGVDSMIVTDMVELARNRAMCDAVLLSGDEDVRIGVQIAQSYGVRVHLLGIVPCRGSQSPHLQQEADTTSEWSGEIIRTFLSVKATPVSGTQLAAPVRDSDLKACEVESPGDETISILEKLASDTVNNLSGKEAEAVAEYVLGNSGVPPEYDKQLLVEARLRLGRDLNSDEKRFLRRKFREFVSKR